MEPHNIPMALLGARSSGSAGSGSTPGRPLRLTGSPPTRSWSPIRAAAVGALAWLFTSWLHGRPSSLGMVTGAVAGLVAITPAAGYVSVHSPRS